MANFEAFCWNISSSMNLLFLKSAAMMQLLRIFNFVLYFELMTDFKALLLSLFGRKIAKKTFSKKSTQREEKKVMKRKENKGQSRWKNDHFFRSFIWNCRKMFLLCRTKNGKKIKNGCQM